jgi:hypothetical protein
LKISQDDKTETQTELTDLISRDPAAVTAAFSDLIIKQNEAMFKFLRPEVTTPEPETASKKPEMRRPEVSKKEPLSTKTPEGEEEDFSEFEPRYFVATWVVANANSGFVFGRALQITYRTDFFQEDDI